jgi:hypothetical protein
MTARHDSDGGGGHPPIGQVHSLGGQVISPQPHPADAGWEEVANPPTTIKDTTAEDLNALLKFIVQFPHFSQIDLRSRFSGSKTSSLLILL